MVGSAAATTHGLTIATNSLDAAIVLSRASRLEVYNIGGTVSPVTRAQEGDWAVNDDGAIARRRQRGVSGRHQRRSRLTEATAAAAAV